MKNMRFNYLVQLLVGTLFCVFVSCKKEPVKSDKGMSEEDVFHLTDTVSKPVESPKITEYRQFVVTLDSSDVTSAMKAVDKFKEIFTGQTPSLCDSAYVVFQAVYDSLERVQNLMHQSDTTNYDPLLYNQTSAIPKKLKDFSKKLQDNGFKLSAVDGVPYIEQDRNFLAKNFYSLVSTVMKEYLVELQKENAEGFELEGAISISPRQLVDRTVWYEKFIIAHPDFVFLNNCKEYQKAYLTYLLSGYGKTEVCDDETTCTLSDYYATAYKYLLSKYKMTQTAQMVQPYYEALKNKRMADAKKMVKDYHVKGIIYSVK